MGEIAPFSESGHPHRLVIADPFVLPADRQPFYSEKIVHLPLCYQPNDTKRLISNITPTRAECGLPEQGFVFCSFNDTYKITPEFFGIWMRLLTAVPGSVLWLLDANELVRDNLRGEAIKRGVDSGRLVFARRQSSPEHLARHRLADLFLDTLPYNAHTTASDALWAGLPVLTCGRGHLRRACCGQPVAGGWLARACHLFALRSRKHRSAPCAESPRFCKACSISYSATG